MSNNAIREADTIRVWMLADNYYDALRPDTEVVKRYRATPGKSIHAEHGLATLAVKLQNWDWQLQPWGQAR